MSKVIKGGTVVTADRTWKADVLIEGERIRQVGENLSGDQVVDAEGAYVIPGGIDPHTHMEMPFMGTRAAETFESGTWSAAVGGTTMLVDFCLPGEDGSIVNAIQEWHRRSEPQICSDIGYHMASHRLERADLQRDGGRREDGCQLVQALHGVQGRPHGRG